MDQPAPHDLAETPLSPAGDASGPVYSIGDLAGELGVSQRAIRFYEDRGMLLPMRVGGNRIYTARDRARLKLILRGKRLGFSLSEIGELLDLYHLDPDHLEQMAQTLKKVRTRIARLTSQQDALTMTLRELREIDQMLVASIHERTAGSAPVRPEHA